MVVVIVAVAVVVVVERFMANTISFQRVHRFWTEIESTLTLRAIGVAVIESTSANNLDKLNDSGVGGGQTPLARRYKHLITLNLHKFSNNIEP